MARSKWPLFIAAGAGLLWGGGRAIDWFSSSHAESAAGLRVGALFSNLHANGDSTIALAMWLTGSTESGSRQLEQGLWNAEYARMMSWVGERVRYPISRYDMVRARIVGSSQGLSGTPAVIVTCEVDGRTLFVRAVEGRALEWAPSGGQ